MLLKKDEIIKRDKRKTTDIEVPEWDGTVRLREMSAAQRDAFDASTVKIVGKKVIPNLENSRAKLLAMCIVDEEGNPMFTVDELSERNASVLDGLSEAARKLNKLDSGALEEEVKN